MTEELFSLAGSRVLITGAGRGLGRVMAEGLARAGADVALVSRTQEELESVAQLVRARGRRALVIPTDVSDSKAVRGAVDQVVLAWGGLDVLVSNAGTNERLPLAETSDESWHHILRTNLDSAFFCAREAARVMERGARMLLIGSVAGIVAIPTGVAYSASKGGMAQMTRSLAQELAPRGIRVNCLAPWYFRTPLTESVLDDEATLQRVLRETPLGRIGEDEDLVGAALFLTSRASGYVTGQTLALDGGMSIARFAPPS